MQRLDAETEDFILRQGGFFNADVAHSLRGEGFDASEDGTGRGVPLVADTLTSNGDAHSGYRDEKGLVFGIDEECNATENCFGTLLKGGQGGTKQTVAYPINSQIAMRHEALGEGTGMGIGASGDPSFTLLKNHSHAVAFDMRGRDGGAQFEGPHDTANIRAADGGSSRSYVAGMQVRRLTPVECERLQGFPDDYTKISDKTADGPRYKSMGNSMAVPVMAWLGERIKKIEGMLSP